MYKSNLDRLLYIMEKLRDKENGCVWCKEQTPQSLSKYAIEEAYELSDAVIKDDVEEYKKELGDLLYQVVFHAQIAKEKELFDFDDIASSIADKLTNRNTHIFGNNKAETIEEIDALWQKEKKKKRLNH